MQVHSFSDVQNVLMEYIPNIGSAHNAYNLSRMEPLMSHLGNPQNQIKAVHIAGTSGKTSTAYYVAEMLRLSGSKVGLTVSPHIDQVNERIQINTVPLEESRYCAYFNDFMGIVQSADLQPTYFELLVAFAFWVFVRESVDYAVVEVGAGGLLDSTNVMQRPDKVCIITDIGMDHTQLLGRTIPAITAHKAGIIRPHNVVFMYDQGDEVMEVVREAASSQQAELHEVWTVANKELPKQLALFQRRNWYLALQAVQYVLGRDGRRPLRDESLAKSVELRVPGRMELFHIDGRPLILDGAHNAQKAQALVKSLRHRFPKSTFTLLFAMLQNQNARLDGVLAALQDLEPAIIITSFKSDTTGLRASISPLKISERCKDMSYTRVETQRDVSEAWKRLCQDAADVKVVVGSFHLLQHVRVHIPLVDELYT